MPPNDLYAPLVHVGTGHSVTHSPAGFVYIVRVAESPYIKIGRTRHAPKTRLTELQGGSPFDLELEYVARVDNAAATERMLHAYLAQHGCHVNGEWFNVGYAAGHITAFMETLESCGNVKTP